jgi:hypothetical protein
MRTGSYPATEDHEPTCSDCLQAIDMETRQAMGCAYEARTTAPQRGYVLARPSGPMLSFTPSACPLYLARLPALAEVGAALPHWRTGQLAQWCEDEPTRALMSACAALADAIEAYTHDPHRPKENPS